MTEESLTEVPLQSLPGVQHRDIETNGVSLHTAFAGREDGPPVVLLHGFPEFWYGWRHQIPSLVDEGYRVVVPDQRGYNLSEKPTGIQAYTLDTLAADVVGLLDALGYERARFVGHDWGGAVLWQLLLRYPDRIARAVSINAPHPDVFGETLTGNPRQLLRSWYMFFFQLPIVPEWTWRADNWRGLRWFIDTSNREHTFTRDVLDRYRQAWSRPGAFTAMLNWYRALFRGRNLDPVESDVVTPPTMLIWGTQDPYLHADMAPRSIECCTDGQLERVADATHWIHHEVPDRVNDLLQKFLAEG